MCGRYVLNLSLAEIASFTLARDGNDGKWNWVASYNVAPSQTVPVIAQNSQGERVIMPMRWGLHPHWSKGMPEGRPMFNARIETAFEKPSFRTPWKRRRALIPVSGWYEWETREGPRGGAVKHPFYIYEPDAPITLLAGLWDHYHVDEGITLLSCSILTTSANGPAKHLHHRMPVRLPEALHADWLNPESKPELIAEAMKTGDDLEFHEVDRTVGNFRNNGPELINKI